MEIAESIYKGVVEPSCKKPTRVDAKRTCHISKMRGESASSTIYSTTTKSAGNSRKRYVDHPK